MSISKVINSSKYLTSLSPFYRLISTSEYNQKVEKIFNSFENRFEKLLGISSDIDIDNGHDSLSLSLGLKGTYIMNKQSYKKEIWLTSPVSGPNDFHYDEKENKWKSVIGDLEEIIPKEIKELYSIDI